MLLCPQCGSELSGRAAASRGGCGRERQRISSRGAQRRRVLAPRALGGRGASRRPSSRAGRRQLRRRRLAGLLRFVVVPAARLHRRVGRRARRARRQRRRVYRASSTSCAAATRSGISPRAITATMSICGARCTRSREANGLGGRCGTAARRRAWSCLYGGRVAPPRPPTAVVRYTCRAPGRGAAWQRTCFGSRGSAVRIRPSRPAFLSSGSSSVG